MKVVVLRGRAIDPGGGKIAGALARSGQRVTLLVWDRDGRFQGMPADYRVQRFGLRAPYDRLEGLLLVPFWMAYQVWFLWKEKPDVVHACDLDTLLPAVISKLLWKTRFCYTIFDFYANNVPSSWPRPIRRALKWCVAQVENALLGAAETLFLADESRREEVRWRKADGVVYIYNSPPDSFRAQAKRGASGPPFSIFYAGNLAEGRGLMHMLEAIETLEGAVLTIAGTGPGRERLQERGGISGKVELLGFLGYEEVIARSLAADLLFRFSDPALYETRLASPNKVFEAMMCGKPILVSGGSAMARRVEKERCGLVVPYGDVAAIRDAVMRLKADPAFCEELGANGRKAYVERYAWALMEERLGSAYRELEKRCSGG